MIAIDRPRCFRCKKAKPANLNNYVMDDAFQAMQSGKELEWQEVIDPTTYQVYYYNKVTGVTQWERPAELGAAPVATGTAIIPLLYCPAALLILYC